MVLPMFPSEFLSLARDWCRGRNWLVRLPVWLCLVWIFVQHLRDPLYTSIFGGLNLGVHELGHVIFSPFGEFVGVAGGTIAQCSLPLIGMVMFWRQGDFFALTFGLGWLSTNLFNVAVYCGDARAMELPLVSIGGGEGGETIHDWDYMLDRFHLLNYDHTIATLIRLSAVSIMLISLAFGAWLLWRMIRDRDEAPSANL